MWTRQHRQNKLGRFIVPTLTVAVLSYFGYHIYHGEYGIDSKSAMKDRAAVLQVRLDDIRAQRTALERRVQLLHDGSIDRDMLDEQARRALDLARADELVIMVEPDRSPN